jgi:hypothetical protein
MGDFGLNSGVLDSKIQDAFKFENRYQMVNDAKMRAVHQVTDYNGFRGMVLGAHLKPVNFRAEPIDEIARRGQGAQKTEGYEATPSSQLYGAKPHETQEDLLSKLSLEDGAGDAEDAPFWPSGASPATPLQFQRDWKKCTSLTLKYRNIIGWEPHRLGSLLKTNLDGDLLADIIAAVHARVQECESAGPAGMERWGRDVRHVWKVLSSLSKVGRFSLARAFLSKADKLHLTAIFSAVRRDCPVGEDALPELEEPAAADAFSSPAAAPELKDASIGKKESEELVRESQVGNAYPMMLPGWEFLGAGTGKESTSSKKAIKKKAPKAAVVSKVAKKSQATPPDAFSDEAAQRLEQFYLET